MVDDFNNKQIFLKKLIYRSKYTGTKETDVLLTKFVDNYLSKLSENELQYFEQILFSGDLRIWKLTTNVEEPKTNDEKNIISLIRKFSNELDEE